ncbi:uridine diphosphate glucose pyrophosphatase, partial [Acrasis kona]
EDINNISYEENVKSKFLSVRRMHYTQNGIKKAWDIVDASNCVAILQYNKTKKNFTLVKQFRPPVYTKHQEKEELKSLGGVTYELCAGLIDKEGKSDLEICREEILEECGYDVPIDRIEKITTAYVGTGSMGQIQSLYYAEVEEDMKVNEGGGVDNELIELYFLPLSQVNDFLFDETKPKPSGLIAAFFWFLHTKLPLYK